MVMVIKFQFKLRNFSLKKSRFTSPP